MLDRRPIATSRLVLEPIDTRHAAGIFAAAADSLEHLLPWMPWADGLTEARIAGFGDEGRAAWDAGRSFDFAIVERGTVVGVATLAVSHGGVGELGYWVGASHAGAGRATEASRALLALAFDQLGLYRVELRAGVNNARSLRVAEKLGFTREGLLRNGLDGSEGPFDAFIFGMTPGDWSAVRP